MPAAPSRFLFFSLLTAAFGAVLFAPGLPGEFVFDDIPNIVGNPVVHMTRLSVDALLDVVLSPQISGFMRILPTVSFAVDSWRSGGVPDPAVFKMTNIVIHGVTTCILAWFFRRLLLVAAIPATRVRWLAPALALAWAAHPLHVSSVLYVVQRLQTLGTLFLVLALWMYLRGRISQIEGRSGRKSLLLAALAWLLALGCKEDSVLLPAYALALELTVLGFRAAAPRLEVRLRSGYLWGFMAAIAAYLIVVLPHYWEWDTYATRNFSTLERLLTQPRVLCMYLGQMLVPLPSNMPFYYDWIQPSRSLFQPWTTLPAIAVLVAAMVFSWRVRARWPLFSMGVFLFFGAHLIASNVVGLELAFEHRNHFALIGVVLAVGSLLYSLAQRLRLTPALMATVASVLIALLGSATLLRSHSWSSNLLLAEASTASAPNSSRAWSLLCMSHIIAGGGAVPANPHLNEAISACTSGAELAPYGLGTFSRLIILKTVRGDVEATDWARLRERIDVVHMGRDNRLAVMMLTHNVRIGVPLDARELIKTLDLLTRKVRHKPYELATIGYFIMRELEQPALAIPHFVAAIESAPPSDSFPLQLGQELRAMGRPDLAEQIQLARSGRRDTPTHSGNKKE